MKGLTLTQKELARVQVLNGVLEKQWSVARAADILGVSERHTWRLLTAYRREGAAALAHGNRGRIPPNATPSEIREKIVAVVQERYGGVNHTHLSELLAEREGLTLSRSTVCRLLMKTGLQSPRHRRPRHRLRRQRMPQAGMLLQIDGSYHAWLEDRGPEMTLLLAIDDATGTAPYAVFQERETTVGYLLLLRGIVRTRGIPLAIYTDRHAAFAPRKPDDPLSHTQVGRALRELGVTQILARSPEAKGRVERANGTFQDRLVAELRLADARTLSDANRILEEFLPRFNQRFGVPPAEAESAYRQPDGELDVDGVLCLKQRRPRAPLVPGPLAGDTIWYEDPIRKMKHRELVRAGMEQTLRMLHEEPHTST